MRDALRTRWGLALAGLALSACAATANTRNQAALTQVDRDLAACRASPSRCPTLALAHGGGDVTPRDIPAGIRISELGCELRDGESCLLASGFYQVREDNAAALRLAERGCAIDHAASCAEVAALVFAEGPLHNERRAFDASLRGCQLGSALGCSNHAVALRQFRGPFDPARREVPRFLRQGCNESNAHGCVLLARSMERGEDGIERDARRAFELYRDACERASPTGCFEYGQLALRADGERAADVPAAMRALDAACQDNEAQACVLLAGVVERIDHPETPRRVAALYSRACQLESPIGCFVLAVLTLRGEGVPQDVERALPQLDRACTVGAASACRELARFYTELSRPDGRAIVRYGDRACELGDNAGCVLAMRARFRHPTAGGRADALETARAVCSGARRAQCPTVVNAVVYEGVASGNELVARDVLPMLDEACARNEQRSCISASSLRLAGLYGIAADATRAVSDLLRVCQSESDERSLACDLSASLTRSGVGTERDLVRALARARRGCEAGHESSCGMAGFMLARAEGADADLAEASRLQQRECDDRAFCARSLDDPRGVAAVCRAAQSVTIGGAAEGETRGDDLFRASCGAMARSPEKVFRLEVRRRDTLRIEAQRLSERYDPVIYVRRTCADERSEVACNDDPLPGLNERSRVERVFEPGTYFIVVDGFGATSAGRFRLSVTSVASASSAASGAGPRA